MQKSYLISQNNPDDFRVINQTFVRQVILDEPAHNACWDGRLTSDGSFYFSVCSEHTNHEYAKLYRYDFDSNTASQCFYTKDFLLKSDRYLRDSKFHTSISEKPDGKLIMVTHSTDKSPCHPVWLPYSFISNPWEGFPGGELMEYDPKTGKVELFGIPAPRESIYGGIYSPKDDAYYMLGWIRGHLYRFDCKTRKCEDKGQVTEYRSYRIALGPDGHVYFSTKSGFLMRWNVDKQCLEDLDVRIPCDKTEKGRAMPFTYMGPCVNGPDGKIYTTGNYTDLLSAYDPATGEIHVVGKLIPAEDYIDIDDQHTFVAGMDFDADGVLWYTCMSFRVMENEHYKAPAGFFRWDFLHGGKPEFLGLFGTPERVQTYSCSLAIDKKRDILYSASTNHSYGSPDIIAVDLAGFRKVMHEKGPVCRDMLVYAPGYEEFRPFGDHWQHVKEQIAAYAANLKAKDIRAVRLWREFSRTDWSAAAVKALRFADDTTLEGICGNAGQTWHFTVRDGRLASLAPASDEDIARLRSDAVQTDSPMPCYPGRQWRSTVSASCAWTNGAQLVGTEDGFLAILRADGSVYSLGPAICQGPVRALCSDLKRGIAYGVGGDAEDIGNVFRYTDAEGLRYLGYISCDRPDDDTGTCANFVLSCCALSPDGCTLAIGAADRLSSVYLCRMEE